MAVGISLFISSCAGAQEESRTEAAARSSEAKKKLRMLQDEWELRDGEGRVVLRPDLERYLKENGEESGAARVRIMLAQIALLERRLVSAEQLLQPVLILPPSPESDEAEVIIAAVENRRGKHEAALARLAPLEGKLLSRESRDQYARERTSAAIATRRWRLTVDAMVAWLVEVGTNTAHVKTWIKAKIDEVPAVALSRLLSEWSEKKTSPSEQEARDWLHRLVIERLSDEALRTRNPSLARDLLEHAPPWLRASARGDELSVLAALAQKEARVVGRAVGVVIGGETNEERRRSARVALGITRGLELGRAQAGVDGVNHLAGEYQGSIGAALGTLSGLGASILIAGVDEKGAAEALAFAEARHVPVIVMSEPNPPIATEYGFVFGVGEQTQRTSLERGLSEVENWIFVGGAEFPCEGFTTRPGTTTLPLGLWKERGVGAVGVMGDAQCSRSVAEQVVRHGLSAKVAWGLEGAHQTWGSPGQVYRLQSFGFPKAEPERASNAISEDERRAAQGETVAQVAPRDWYFTLGLDVAKIVRVALSELPQTQVTEKEEVTKRHQLARSALKKARVSFISTSANGFNESQGVDRELVVVSAHGSSKDGGR